VKNSVRCLSPEWVRLGKRVQKKRNSAEEELGMMVLESRTQSWMNCDVQIPKKMKNGIKKEEMVDCRWSEYLLSTALCLNTSPRYFPWRQTQANRLPSKVHLAFRAPAAHAFGFSRVLLVVMAISKDRLDERIPESDKAQRDKGSNLIISGVWWW